LSSSAKNDYDICSLLLYVMHLTRRGQCYRVFHNWQPEMMQVLETEYQQNAHSPSTHRIFTRKTVNMTTASVAVVQSVSLSLTETSPMCNSKRSFLHFWWRSTVNKHHHSV